MMRHLVPLLLSACVYVGYRYYCCRERVDKKLWMEALLFSLIASVVMFLYHNTYGYEYFATTFGNTCPPGHIKVDDPMDMKQQTCKPDPRGNSLMHAPPKKA
jgi:hypothetical protein